MKGLILAAGLGTRLRPLTSLRPKPLIAVANKPLIVHAINNLVEADVTEIGIVVSHDTIDYIKEALEDYQGASFHYTIQDPPLGLAHAVQSAQDFLGDDPFVMYLSDNLFEHGIADFVKAYRPDEGVNAVLALVQVPDPRAFGVVTIENGTITKLVEKPKDPPSNLAVAGVYVFDKHIHGMIEGLEPSGRGEYEITDAIARLIDSKHTVAPVEVSGWWKDTGKPGDILDANRLELLKLCGKVEGQVEDSELVGDIQVEEGAVVKNSRVVGPVMIGAGSRVENAYIGPYTTLGREVTVKDAELEYSVVEQGTRLEGIKTRIQGSLIGANVTISGNNKRPGSHELILGDKSRVQLSE